nr:SDR family NAD(P)-dependent oxidoreductase [Agrobacterium tumefaciens]
MIIALITGASSGIGTVYARRLAARGHNLVLVARATDRLNALADELRSAHGVTVEVITADLTDAAQTEPVAQRLRADPPIDILVNNAGAGLSGGLANADPVALENLLRLNSLVPTLLTAAVIPGMLQLRDGGTGDLSAGDRQGSCETPICRIENRWGRSFRADADAVVADRSSGPFGRRGARALGDCSRYSHPHSR